MLFFENSLEFLDCNGTLDYDELIEEIEQEIKLSKKIWTTRDGRDINIKDMETSHITNTIKMIVRNSDMSDVAKRYIEIFINELISRSKK